MPIATELSINTGADALQLAQTIFGSGVTVGTATLTGAAGSSAIYSGADATLGEIAPADGGIILSTGMAEDFTNSSGTTNTNTASNTTTDHEMAGDADLTAQTGQTTYDATILEATFTPDGDYITMQFVFSSEEYLEYVNSGVNDAFGVWVNEVYAPLTIAPDGLVSIDTINNITGSNLYLDNPRGDDTYNTEMDGLTRVLTLKAPVIAGASNSIKIAIADGGDGILDSNVLIAANSVQSVTFAFDDTINILPNATAVFDILSNDVDTQSTGLTITEINGTAVVAGDTVTLSTGEQVTLQADGTISVTSDSDLGSNPFSYTVVDGAGNSDIGLVTLVTTPTPPNYIVEGDDTDNLIDVNYTGDPENDRIDNSDALNGSQDDSVQAGAGNDTILSGLGNDSVDAGDGDDSIEGGAGSDTLYGAMGNDTVLGGAGDDSLYGNEGDDSLVGGAGDDTFEGGIGNDTIIGGDGNDSINGDFGDDVIIGGAGDDFLRGSFGNDTITGGTGADTLWGGFGDDVFLVAPDFGSYTIEGEEEDETVGDTMDLSNIVNDLTVDLTNANPEAGSFTDGTNTGTFVDVETIILGSGDDTLVLGTFGGSDTVSGFSAPTDTGGGTFSGNDLLDVSGLVDFDGNPTHTGNVTVTEVGGNAVLGFANGETLTLVGVSAASVASPAQLIAMGIPEGPDGYVDGTAGDDTIDGTYTGDPNFDRVDNDDAILPGATSGDDDYIRAGAGDDSVLANAGNDIVEGGSGDDTIDGGAGADTLRGDAGNDSLIGGLGDDSLSGGSGDDTLNGQIGDDVLDGGAGSDSFALEDDFGSDTIIGGEIDDAAGDTLDMSGVGGALRYDLTDTDAESGTVSDGTGTITFSEIENITLSSGLDTLVLSNGSGADVVNNFTPPTLAGDGSYFGADQLDVSTMTDANGALVNTGDVTISDTNGDGSGDTILTFPGGESLTLVGVPPSAFPTPEALAAIGIPLADYIVEGTAADDLIDTDYLGDPEGDMVDASDAADGSQDDSIEAGAGNDTVLAGAGDDAVLGEAGDDLISGEAGDDTVFAGEGNDTVLGGTGADSLVGQTGDDSLLGQAGEDRLEGGAGDDTLSGGTGDDTLDGGADDDVLTGNAGADSLLGNFGDDTLIGGTGDDIMEGGFGDDSFLLSDGFGNDTIDGEADLETDGDTLDASGVTTEGVSVVYSSSEAGTLTGTVSGDSANFSDIENITTTDNADTIDASADSLGINLDAAGGDDLVTGGSGSDTIDGGTGSDTLSGGASGDLITAGDGDDTINVAQGDTVFGGDGDDFFNIVDLGETDTDVITITGGEGAETLGDTLALNGLQDASTLVITDPDDVNGGLSGTVTLLDGTVVNFSNIENIICFVPGTGIATPFGRRNIEDLKVGDVVVTQDNGLQSIRWIGTSTVPATGNFAPVHFARSVFPGAEAGLTVSPQHRMLFKGYQASLLFGESEVLVPAVHLVNDLDVCRVHQDMVTYIHIMFDQHEIIFADGIATESFHPGVCGVNGMAACARDEMFSLFPALRSDLTRYGQSARVSLRAKEARLLASLEI